MSLYTAKGKEVRLNGPAPNFTVRATALYAEEAQFIAEAFNVAHETGLTPSALRALRRQRPGVQDQPRSVLRQQRGCAGRHEAAGGSLTMPKKKLKSRPTVARRSSDGRGHRRVSAKPRVLSWPARIKAARARGEFLPSDRGDAMDWQTCACGRLDVAIERHSADGMFTRPDGCSEPVFAGEPKDSALSRLGSEFFEAVSAHEFTDASRLIAAITKRAAEVLREQRSKP